MCVCFFYHTDRTTEPHLHWLLVAAAQSCAAWAGIPRTALSGDGTGAACPRCPAGGPIDIPECGRRTRPSYDRNRSSIPHGRDAQLLTPAVARVEPPPVWAITPRVARQRPEPSSSLSSWSTSLARTPSSMWLSRASRACRFGAMLHPFSPVQKPPWPPVQQPQPGPVP